MKKIFVSAIIILMLIMPIAGASNILSMDNAIMEAPSIVTNEEFTHTVIVESGTLTTCPYCVDAASQLYSIYNAGDLDFHYVTLVLNKVNYRVQGRATELGISAVPDVFFDGKYKHIKGRQPDEQPYRNAITQAGMREVSDVDLDVSVQWRGGGTLKITVVVYNNDPENFTGHLRTYIVEKESRWNDNGGNPYHYAVIDIAIDSALFLTRAQAKPTRGTHTFTKTWYGALNGFGDITQENIEVVAAVFDGDTDYAVETATGEPTLGPPSNHRTSNLPILKIITQRFMDRFPLLAKLLTFR